MQEDYRKALQPAHRANFTNIRKSSLSFPMKCLPNHSAIEKLFLMQHYGFPTRLMDASKNPLVGIFFACFADKGQEDSRKKAGVAYVYAVPKEKMKFSGSGTVSILANLCKPPEYVFGKGTHPSGQRRVQRGGTCSLSGLRHTGGKTAISQPHRTRCHQLVVCLRPRMNNPRIIRRDGRFFLFGIDGDAN